MNPRKAVLSGFAVLVCIIFLGQYMYMDNYYPYDKGPYYGVVIHKTAFNGYYVGGLPGIS